MKKGQLKLIAVLLISLTMVGSVFSVKNIVMGNQAIDDKEKKNQTIIAENSTKISSWDNNYPELNIQAFKDDIGYSIHANQLTLFNFENKTSPTVVSEQILDKTIVELEVLDNYLYLIDISCNLYRYNISIADSPVLIGFYEISGGIPDDVVTSEDLVIILSDEIVYFVNLSKTQNSVNANSTISAKKSVLYYQHYLITLGTGWQMDGFESRLLIYDILNTSKPELLINITDTDYYFESGFVFNNYLYVESNNPLDNKQYHLIYNLTNILATYRIGVVDCLGTFVNAQINEKILLFVDASNGGLIYNFTQPFNPILIDTIQGNYSSHYQNLFIQENYLYLSNAIGGIEVFSRVDFVFIYENTIAHSSYAEDIFVHGEFIFIAEGFGGLEIVNASDPYQPFIIAEFISGPNAYYHEIVVEDDIAYILDVQNYFLELIDISNITNPIFVESVAIKEDSILTFYGLAVRNNIAYVYAKSSLSLLGRFWYLLTVDCSNPTAPVILDSFFNGFLEPMSISRSLRKPLATITNYQPPKHIGLAISGKYLFGGGLGLIIFDISNPSNIQLTSPSITYPHENLTRWYLDIAIANGYAFIPNGPGSIFYIYNIQNINNIYLSSYLNITELLPTENDYYMPKQIAMNNNIAYLSCINTVNYSSTAIVMINCKEISQPKLIGYYIDNIYISNIHAIGNLVFATAGYSGSLIIKHNSLEIIWPPATTTQSTRKFGYESLLLLMVLPVIYTISKIAIKLKRKE